VEETREASGTVEGRDGRTYDFSVTWVVRGNAITLDAVSRLQGSPIGFARIARIVRKPRDTNIEWFVTSLASADIAAGLGMRL